MKVKELLLIRKWQEHLKQFTRIMKCTVVLMLLGCLHVYADGFSQSKISLRLQQADLKKALFLIEKQSHVRFLYNANVVKSVGKVSVQAENEALAKVLDDLLEGTGVTYKILEDDLVVLNLNGEMYAAEVKVTGSVTDSSGVPIAGASVVVKGTNNGTSTDAAGKFTITVAEDATLVFSAVGFTGTQEAVGGRSTINILLFGQLSRLDEVVVIGYGTQRKVDITGSVTQIKGEEISKQSVVNPISGLQGKVAGLQVTNAGAPGSSPQIRIRGVGTVYGNANPLYVVDGVWFDDISFLNPADIENLSVLKDASSEAIYGIRAANGVILITTKKGRSNRTAVSYNGYVGNQVVTNQIKMASGPEYAQMVNELDLIGGVKSRYTNPEGYGTTDWYHQILRNAVTTNHQVSVAGGSDRVTYNFSLGYLLQDGIIEKNRFERYTARLQNDFKVFEPLKVGYTIAASMNKSTDINGSLFHQLFSAVPIVPVYYADGTYGDPNDFTVTSSANFNPQVTLDFFNQKSKNYRLNGNVYADLKFAQHFTFHSSVGGDFGQNEVRNYLPVYTATLVQRNTISRLSLTNGATRNWILENTLTYDNKFGDHSVKILAGQGAQSYQYRESTATAENVPNNSDGDYYLTLGSNRNITDFGSFDRVVSYFGRANYAFQDKYLLTATIRADGSSKFSGDNRWGYFPSVGAGWVVSKEGFMQDQHVFNSLKIRGSWGKIGNMSVPANLSVLKVTQTPQLIYVGGNGTTATGASINTIVPPTTYWEKGVGTDIGIEASMFKNKLYAEITYYNRKTENAIFDIPILGSLGTSGSTITGNQATFQNQGLEVLLTWKNTVLNSRLSYSLSGNLGYNQNKVLEVSTGTNPIYQAVGTTGSNNWNTRTIQGQPIGQFVGLQAIGVFQTGDEVKSYVSKTGAVIMPNAKPGDLKFADINEDGVIDDKDRVVTGNPNPKYTYGFNTNFSFLQFDLTLDFQGLAGVDIYNANLALRFGTENFTQDFYKNRWHGAGTSNLYPSVNLAGGQNPRANSFYVEDGSYFRVRNAQLGYTISQTVTDRWKIKSLRIFVNAQNPLNFFKYRGFSPEVGGSPTRAGVDVNVYPLYATYSAGVNLNF